MNTVAYCFKKVIVTAYCLVSSAIILSACNSTPRNYDTEFHRIAYNVSDEDHEIGILLKDESTVYPIARKKLFDDDKRVRTVAMLFIARSTRGFERETVLKYWDSPPGNEPSDSALAGILIRNNPDLAHELWKTYICNLQNPSLKLIRTYCVLDQEFIIHELVTGEVPSSVRSRIEEYAYNSGSTKAIREALQRSTKSDLKRNSPIPQ